MATAADIDWMLEVEEEMRMNTDTHHSQHSTQRPIQYDRPAKVAAQPPVQSNPPPPVTNSWYGLPPEVQFIYKTRRVNTLYQWQQDVLHDEDVVNFKNFVYSLPTSGGKTLVAEILCMRSVFQRTKSAMFVLPFISVAEEKAASFEMFANTLNFRVEGFYGVNGRLPPPRDVSVYVCTIEKANSLVNSLLEEGRMDELGTIVVDELHMVGDPHRGPTLEILLAKIRLRFPNTQIVGMSATVPNLCDLAKWLGAKEYVSDFRPVPLSEHIVRYGEVMDVEGNVLERIGGSEMDIICKLVDIPDGASTLLFCPTRASTADAAIAIAGRLGRVDGYRKRSIVKYFETLQNSPVGQQLAQTMPWGVAFHHGAMSMDERSAVEQAFRDKVVTTLCCTSTLAAGVNLPARRVVFKSPQVGRDFLSKSQYKQMCGRAGRAGLDTKGESFLVVSNAAFTRAKALLGGESEPVRSKLVCDTYGLARFVLECFGSGLSPASGISTEFVASSLLCSVTNVDLDFTQEVAKSVGILCERCLVEQEDVVDAAGSTRASFKLTALGASALKSCISIDEVGIIKSELEKAQAGGVVLSDDMHLCYLLTPIRDVIECNWQTYQLVFDRLGPTRQRIAHAVGVNEGYIQMCSSGIKPSLQTEGQKRDFFATKKFFTALVLADLLSEVPPMDIEGKYGVNRGLLESLLKNASLFSSSMTSFCAAMEWSSLECLFASFVKRLGYGVKPEIIPLMEIRGVQTARARMLWNAGYKDVKSIAEADPEVLLKRVQDANVKNKGAKFFSRSSAGNVVREAHRVVQAMIKTMQTEIVQLSVPSL